MTALEGLPFWVWVNLAWIEEYEDVHARDETCMKKILDDVPADARAYGRAYLLGYAEALMKVKGPDA